MKLHRNRWTAVGLACLLAVSGWSVPFMEWTGMTVYAATVSGKCGKNLTWKLENGTLTISGTGEMNKWVAKEDAPWFPSRNSITAVFINEGITSIGMYAFAYCTRLSSITIPGSVTSIGNLAFENCTGLSSITILDGVKSIGESAFAYCTGLSSITISDSVTSIGMGAFYGCTGLNNITIPGSVTSIGQSAFARCTGLSSITISNGVTSIVMYAFSGCTGLNSITIPNSVTSIGKNAFDNCSKLSSVTYLGTKAQWEKISSSFPANINVTLHKHTADNKWQSDQNYHWHQCTNSECPAQESNWQDGYAEHKWKDGGCTICGYACEHNDSDGKSMLVKTEEKTPTCTEPGYIAYWTCSKCGLKFRDEAGNNKLIDGEEVLPALTHHYSENPVQTDWKKNATSHWLECDRSTCSDIPDSIKEQAVHTYESKTSQVCTICKYDRGHQHSLTLVSKQEASCTEAGHEAYYTCSGCDSLFADDFGAVAVSLEKLTIPATGHKYDGDTCTICGYQKPETSTTRSSGGSHHDSAEVTDNSQKGRWVQDEKGWYFRRNDGSYPKSGWSKLYWLGKEYWYYFDENGYMKLGWLDVNGSRYYMNPVIGTNSGKMLTGWQQIDQKWYYFSTETGAKEGSLLRNTVTPDNYTVDENGIWQQ